MELAEEARNVSVESGQSCYTEEVQSQEAGLTRPVLVTVIEYSLTVLKEGAMIAPGIFTEMIPTTLSAGRRDPVDQLDLVGPQDKNEQSVLPGSHTNEVGTDPAGPVGPDVTDDQVQPVGQYITHRPVGPDGIFSTCDSDQPMADGPVGRFITRSPVGSDGMLSTCDSDRPVADGPMGQSYILGPVGPRRMFSQCKPNQPVAVGPVGQAFTTSPVSSTVIPDPVEEMGSPIQTDEDIQYNDVTICRKEHSLENSGTDGGNSGIGVLADCSEDEEESHVEEFSGCRMPGCQCEGRIEYMEWGSEDMTDTDDSKWEDPDEREKRLHVERYNFDLFEGMTHLTYTPPTRRNRRRRYEDRGKYGPESQEPTGRTSELGFQTDEEPLSSELTVQSGMVADEDIPTHRDKKDTYEPNVLTGCDADSPSGELSEIIDRPVTESVTARSGIDTEGQASLGDTPPSGDSGIHSFGEQWENMSISTADTESEQNGRPTSCSTTGRRDSDTRVPPNTEEDEDVICPWMDCLLNEESDEFSSVDIPNYRKDIQYNDMTICRREYSL